MNLTRSFPIQMAALLVAGSAALAVAPAQGLAAPTGASLSSGKSVSLQLSDVRRLVDRSLTAGPARYSAAQAMGACTSTPPKTDFTENFGTPVGGKGVLAVISQVFTYGSSAGPTCNQKLALTQAHTLGKILGVLKIIHGVGTQSYLLDTTGPKTSSPPVYTLGLNFTRGVYRALIIVQSNKKISDGTLMALGKIVDARMRGGH
jgi:hypothetical protein